MGITSWSRGEAMTPSQAIRKTCLDCVGWASKVKDCQGDKLNLGPCPFYPHRMGKGRAPLRVIRRYCLACMNGQILLVRDCASKTCPLQPYRRGKRPALAGRKPSARWLENLLRAQAVRHRLKSQNRPRAHMISEPGSTIDH